jgi:hypothetical protein
MTQNRRARILAVAFAVAFFARPASAQPADPLTQRIIAGLVAPAMVHVRAILNEDSSNAPALSELKLEFMTRAEFHKLPDPECDLAVRARVPELRDKNLARAQQSARDAVAEVALARYRPGAESIAVALPLDERRIGSWSATALPDPPETAALRTLQLAIVHEVVRQHLDRQYHWRNRLPQCRDEDELRTWQALIEGRALHVTEQVADKLGTYAYANLLTQRYRTMPDMGPDPERLSVVRALVFRQKFDACTQGKEFFARLTREGMKSIDGTVFTTPPRQALWVARPEFYVKALRGSIPDLDKVLDMVRRKERPRGINTAIEMTQNLGPEMVREVAGALQQQARAEAILKGWEEGRTLLWATPNMASSLVVSVARFDTAGTARAYHGLSLDLQRKRDEMMNSNCTSASKVVESRCEAVEMPHADTAARCFKKVQYNGGRTTDADMIYVLAGCLVIEVDGFSTPVDPAWVRQVVASIVEEFKIAPPPVAN